MTTKSGPDPDWDYANNILKNVRGLADQKRLDKLERVEGYKALSRLEEAPVNGKFDQAHLQEIHRRIFEKVYPWVGELRQVNIARAASFSFAMVQFMQGNLDKTFSGLAAENHLKGLEADRFSGRAGHYLGELNTLHPFREGNGRTQREFIRELAAEARPRMNWNRVSQEQMYAASAESHNQGNNVGLPR
jgi:cell filamentation protein